MIARLADRGEQTLARLAELPGGAKALGAMNDLRARVDELGKKVRGIDELEQRVAKLEKELAAVKRAQKPKPQTPPSRLSRPGSQASACAGTRSCSAAGSTSKRAGVVPGCSPSSSTGTGSSVST